MKAWPIFILLAIAGCGNQEPTPAPAAATPAEKIDTSKTDSAKTAPAAKTPAETASPEELAQREYDTEVVVFKKWVEANYSIALNAFNQPLQPGEPPAMIGEESQWPLDKRIAFVQRLKRQAGPPPADGVERAQKICAEGTARYKKLANHPYAEKRPWELPKRPEFSVEILIKQHQERANNYYQQHLRRLAEIDRYAAQEIDTGIPVPAEERAARATHDADKKRVGNLRNVILHHADGMGPISNYNDIQTRDLRKWVAIAKDYHKRYAETKLFDPQAVANLRKECREMAEAVERLKVSCERFGEKIPYGIPEPATYDADALIAARAPKRCDRIMADLDKGMAFYSPLAVSLVKEGKTEDEIVAAVEKDRQEQLDKLLADRKTILASWQETQQKFEQATTLEEMKTTAEEAQRIYNNALATNTREIELWRSKSQQLGLTTLAEQGVLPRESLPLGSMLGRIRMVEQKKLDVSDPTVREKFTPLK